MKGLIMLALGAWGATQLYKSAQRRRGGGTDPLAAGMSRASSSGSGFPSADVDASGGSMPSSSASGAFSPNAAERMQSTGSGGAFAGVAGGGATPQVFPEAERQDGDEPRPGLPDFARGA